MPEYNANAAALSHSGPCQSPTKKNMAMTSQKKNETREPISMFQKIGFNAPRMVINPADIAIPPQRGSVPYVLITEKVAE